MFFICVLLSLFVFVQILIYHCTSSIKVETNGLSKQKKKNKKMEAGTNGNALTALLNGSHGYIWLMLILVHWTFVGIVNSSVYTKISNAMRPMLCQWACRYCPQPNTSNRPAPKKPKHVHPFFFFFLWNSTQANLIF